MIGRYCELNNIEEIKNITIIQLDYREPNVYYIELDVYKSKLVPQMEVLKSTLPALDIKTRKRFMGYQQYIKKFNSLLNAEKTLNRIYENGIKNARIVKSTAADYKNNYEFRVKVGPINSNISNVIKSNEFEYLRIVKSYFKSKIIILLFQEMNLMNQRVMRNFVSKTI